MLVTNTNEGKMVLEKEEKLLTQGVYLLLCSCFFIQLVYVHLVPKFFIKKHCCFKKIRINHICF